MRRALFLPRVLTNPALHATILIRLAYATPQSMIALWRNILLTKHTMCIMKNIDIGPGLKLPHPWGVTIGEGLRIGANCTIFHNVSIGSRAHHQRTIAADGITSLDDEGLCPTIGDDVVIYHSAMIVGPVTIGDGAIVGACTWVDRDVPPGSIVSAGRQ